MQPEAEVGVPVALLASAGVVRCRPLHLAGCCGEAVEMFWCLVRQFNVASIVHKEELSLMRAAFYLTHNIDSGADPPALPCWPMFDLCTAVLAHELPAAALDMHGHSLTRQRKAPPVTAQAVAVLAISGQKQSRLMPPWHASSGMHVCMFWTGAEFDFVAYVTSSMEEDYSSLVGLGLAMWLFLIVFVLLSAKLGACPGLRTHPSPCVHVCSLVLLHAHRRTHEPI